MIQLSKVSKVYEMEAGRFTALKETNLAIGKGEFVAIMGPSGSGKSTLLQLLGGLDVPTTGEVRVNNIEINRLTETERTLFRRTHVGFVFQNYQLLPMMSVTENVGLALAAGKAGKQSIQNTVSRLLREVGLADKAASFPSQLSGGQQQRVAIARSLAMSPALLLADEPTGNLDGKRGDEVLHVLTRLNREEGITIVMVTHDLEAAKTASRIIRIRDGEVVEDGMEVPA